MFTDKVAWSREESGDVEKFAMAQARMTWSVGHIWFCVANAAAMDQGTMSLDKADLDYRYEEAVTEWDLGKKAITRMLLDNPEREWCQTYGAWLDHQRTDLYKATDALNVLRVRLGRKF